MDFLGLSPICRGEGKTQDKDLGFLCYVGAQLREILHVRRVEKSARRRRRRRRRGFLSLHSTDFEITGRERLDLSNGRREYTEIRIGLPEEERI